MNTTLGIALTFPAIIAATLVTTQPLKALVEVFCSPANRAHDAIIQLLAMLVGLVWAGVFVWAEQPLSRSAAVEAIITILLGLGGGAGAIGAHNVATTSTSSGQPPEQHKP